MKNDQLRIDMLEWIEANPAESGDWKNPPNAAFPQYSKDDVWDGCRMLVEEGYIKGLLRVDTDGGKSPRMKRIDLLGKKELERLKKSLSQRLIDHAKAKDVDWIYKALWFIIGSVATLLLRWL
ncbi:MAG: hypothetical protein HOI70_08355 [Opitutae bacterium]|nr:hypothetical protein [Opitutae bacterium]